MSHPFEIWRELSEIYVQAWLGQSLARQQILYIPATDLIYVSSWVWRRKKKQIGFEWMNLRAVQHIFLWFLCWIFLGLKGEPELGLSSCRLAAVPSSPSPTFLQQLIGRKFYTNSLLYQFSQKRRISRTVWLIWAELGLFSRFLYSVIISLFWRLCSYSAKFYKYSTVNIWLTGTQLWPFLNILLPLLVSKIFHAWNSSLDIIELYFFR